jgi:nitroreductase
MKNASSDLWDVSPAEFPHAGPRIDQWKFLLRYAVLAPSSHNTQPWLFHIRGNELELYADRTRALRVVDPHDRELIISCGCALFHLRCAMAHFGYLGGVDILPDPRDPDLLARVSMGSSEETSPDEARLFGAIPRRRTNRQPFTDEPVPPALLTALSAAAREEFAWLHAVSSEHARTAVADLIAQADCIQWSNKRFRLELAAWVHPNRSNARDGIPGYAQGIDDLLSYAGPLVIRTFDMGEGQAARDHELATGSPALVVLGTRTDTVRDWIHAGQALARILLRARVEDVWASFLNQPIELPELRHRLTAVMGVEGHAQICLRLGRSTELKPTPRRGVDEVLI